MPGFPHTRASSVARWSNYHGTIRDRAIPLVVVPDVPGALGAGAGGAGAGADGAAASSSSVDCACAAGAASTSRVASDAGWERKRMRNLDGDDPAA